MSATIVIAGARVVDPAAGVDDIRDVADLPNSVIEEQVTNGIAVRMALLYLLLGGSGAETSSEGGEAA